MGRLQVTYPSNLLTSPYWTTFSSMYLCMQFFPHFSKIAKIKIRSVKCNHLQYLNRIVYSKLQYNVMHIKINFLKPLPGLTYFYQIVSITFLNYLYLLCLQSQLNISLHSISLVCQFMPVRGLFLESSQAYVSLDQAPFCYEKTYSFPQFQGMLEMVHPFPLCKYSFQM